MAAGSVRRTEAMLHALLVDHGFRVDSFETIPATTVYYHLRDERAVAKVERRKFTASVTLSRGDNAEWWTCKPEILREILDRELDGGLAEA